MSSMKLFLRKGEDDIKAGRTVTYKSGLMKEILKKGKERFGDSKSVKEEVKRFFLNSDFINYNTFRSLYLSCR